MLAVVAAAITFLSYRNRRTASIIGLVVVSPWGLDFIVHPGELPLLFNGSPTVGLGLWTWALVSFSAVSWNLSC
jgi:hypothetical protein